MHKGEGKEGIPCARSHWYLFFESDRSKECFVSKSIKLKYKSKGQLFKASNAQLQE
jgi:hypothetical protein